MSVNEATSTVDIYIASAQTQGEKVLAAEVVRLRAEKVLAAEVVRLRAEIKAANSHIDELNREADAAWDEARP